MESQKKILIAIVMVFSSIVFTYAQEYKIQEGCIVKLDKNNKVIFQSKKVRDGIVAMAFKDNVNFVVAASNSDDYSKLTVFTNELEFKKEKLINASSDIKTVYINDKYQIVVQFTNGDVSIYDSELNKIS